MKSIMYFDDNRRSVKKFSETKTVEINDLETRDHATIYIIDNSVSPNSLLPAVLPDGYLTDDSMDDLINESIK